MKYLKLMADYQCYPLWNVSPGECGDIAPNELPISVELQQRLLKWAEIYNETLDKDYPPNSGFKNQEQENEFRSEGEMLAKFLKNELGSNFSIILDI